MLQLLWGSESLRLQPVQCRVEKRLAGWCAIGIASLRSSCWAQFWEAKICSERDDLGFCKPYQWHKGCEMLWNVEVKFSLSWAFLEMCPIGDYHLPFGISSWSCREAAGFGILQ